MTDMLRDSITMTGREFRRALRFPLLLVGTIAVPVVMLRLFDYILGGPRGRGLGSTSYLNFLVPGILVMTVAAGTAGTAINVCLDMNGGIMDRFRTMPIARSAILTGHVVSNVVRTLTCTAAVTVVALLIGFRPTASPSDWLMALGLVAAFTFALAWLAAALGLVARSVAGANSSTLPIQFLLPFLSSTFVPASTMPAGVRWFSANQPFTQVVDSLRDLLAGKPAGDTQLVALGWCLAIAALGFVWASTSFNRGARRE